ncbi:MAG: hypothetical protein WD825_17160 [Gemmatimonadaceae bacterium]
MTAPHAPGFTPAEAAAFFVADVGDDGDDGDDDAHSCIDPNCRTCGDDRLRATTEATEDRMIDAAAAAAVAVLPANIDDAITEAIDGIDACVESLASYQFDPKLPADEPVVELRDAIEIERLLRAVLDLLRVDPIRRHADAAHATAAEAAARICEARARSQRDQSKNPLAALEATKCAHAIRHRIAARAGLLDWPELTTPGGNDA